jgi:hypothetical protein
MNPGRFRSIERHGRVGKITDENSNTARRCRGRSAQPPAVRAVSRRRERGRDLARLLRKQPGERSHTMIAATAFAVVGLVVVAFLNRIP